MLYCREPATVLDFSSVMANNELNHMSGRQNMPQRNQKHRNPQHQQNQEQQHNYQISSPNLSAFRHHSTSQPFNSHSQKPHPCFSKNTQNLQSNQGDDDEAVAKKKKNADAQAAFRQRRQTYIRSLEDTVVELKKAVTDMEIIVKTTGHEIKVQRDHVNYLENKLAAYELGKLKPPGCTCFSLGPGRTDARDEINNSNNCTTSNDNVPSGIQSSVRSNTSDINFSKVMSRQTDSSSNISTVPSNKSWTGLQIQASQSYPSAFNSYTSLVQRQQNHHYNLTNHSLAASRRNCSGPDSQSNALSNLNSDPINLRPPGGNLTFFGPFDTTSPNQILNQPCHSASRSHSKSPHPVTESISPKLACTLEVEPCSNSNHLHPIIPTSFDHSPAPVTSPITPHSLVNQQSPQFDNNHSISIHSPPIWAQQSSQNIAGCPYDTTGGCNSLEAGLTKSGVPQPESNSLSEANRSVLRWQSTDRTMNRFSDYLPSLKARSGNDTSRYALPSPTAASSSFDSLNARTFTTNKRQRGSDDERLDAEICNENSRMRDNSLFVRPGILGGANTNKLTGLPAKVAKCEQARLEASQVVSQAKVEVQAISRMPNNSVSNNDSYRPPSHNSMSIKTHSSSQSDVQSLQGTASPDANVENPSHDSGRFRRLKLNGTFSGAENSCSNQSSTFNLSPEANSPSSGRHQGYASGQPESLNINHSSNRHQDHSVFTSPGY